MNIHPLFVHFPIALLVLYSLFEIVRIKKINKEPYWFYVKAVFVIFGSAFSVITAITGDIAKDLLAGTSSIMPLIDKHEMFAAITITVYGVIALAYLIEWVNRTSLREKIKGNKVLARMWKWLFVYRAVVMVPFILVILAVVGLVSVFITGALGASIVYGPEFDFATTLVNRLFVE